MSCEIVLDERELYDLECLLIGAFEPLQGFMREDNYHCVLEKMELLNGDIWPMPITLASKRKVDAGSTLVLKDPQGIPLANLVNVECYEPDIDHECQSVLGTTDNNHPHVRYLRSRGKWYLGGELQLIQLPHHYDFPEYRQTPAQVKEFFAAQGWKTIVGFQTRNPMHRSHYCLSKHALELAGPDAKLLLNPAVGPTQACDVDYYTRTKVYIAMLDKYPPGSVHLTLLPLAMRMAGPRSALFHALIRQNYGCTHFVVGRDHAGPSYKTIDGKDFYEPYAAQELLETVKDRLKIQIITCPAIVYIKTIGEYLPITQVEPNAPTKQISGTRQRELLELGLKLPTWFTFPEVSQILAEKYPPRSKQGFCVYFVGLSGSGKSTIANFLCTKLRELSPRRVTILDGDVVRHNLSKGLGFDRESRSTNVRRVGWVASEIVRHGGVCICATIAPYQADRDYNRELISENGHYIEVHVSTPLSVCEERDTKGLYKRAREGLIENFTGISDPFEKPQYPDLTLDATSIDELPMNLEVLVSFLQDRGLIGKN